MDGCHGEDEIIFADVVGNFCLDSGLRIAERRRRTD